LEKIRADVAWEGEMAKRDKLTDYNSERSRLQLEVAVELAEDALIQVVEDNEAKLAQAAARLQAAKRSLEKEEERLARYREQLEKCNIFAPQNGMVAYHVERSRWRQSANISEGVAVNPRQPILSLPDLTRMQVELSVHESVVDRVQAGMRGTVRLDAFPKRSYEATVDEVAVLPDPGGWLSSDTKVYKTIVKLDETLDGEESRSLKPGMTAVVDIHIANLEDVLCIPVQAVVQRGNQTWCYVARDNQPEKRIIELGQTNDKFVEISAGLERGERVVLNPSAILESEPTEQREIGPSRKQTDTARL
jgi:RND family efflux transporter MFP subunit